MIALRTQVDHTLNADPRNTSPAEASMRNSVAVAAPSVAAPHSQAVNADLSEVTVDYRLLAGGDTVAYSAYCNVGDTIEITDIGDGAIEAHITHEPTGVQTLVAQVDGVYRSLCAVGGKYIIQARNTLPFKTEVAVARFTSSLAGKPSTGQA